jgi:hypothetical protein
MNTTNRMANRLTLFPLLALACCFSAESAEAGASWRSECVGTLAVDLPAEVEVAAVPLKNLVSELNGRPRGTTFRFSDGEDAGWSSLRYFGEILVTGRLSLAEASEAKALFAKNRREYPALVSKAPLQAGKKVEVADVFPPTKEAMAWRINDTARLLIEKDSHVLIMTIPRNMAASYAENTKLRNVFSVPDSAALCLPYMALPMGEERERDIFVTYRLLKHPDVTVMVGDSNAVKYDDPVREANAASPRVVANFWAQYEMGKKIDYLRKPSTFSIDSREGLESFVKIVRNNGDEDYGYFATVRGIYGTKPDQATIQVYVLRNARSVRQKNVEPISKDELLDLARKITRSIRHR